MTSYASAPARWCYAISKPKRRRTASKTGTWLAAYDTRRLGYGRRRRARPSVPLRGNTFRREGRPYGEYDTDHQQQELLVMVAARLAAREILRPALRGGRH